MAVRKINIMSQRASFTTQGNKILLRIEYNKRAVEVLKNTIHPSNRSYDKTTNTWSIDTSHINIVNDIINQFYPDVNQKDIRTFQE
jgi:UDP-N-acetylglucosamine pyrophosphorylase